MLSWYDLGWLLLSFVFSSFLSDAPQVSLRLGRTLDADNIRTGHDVYFECDVKANPPALRLEWLHNVSISILSYIFNPNASHFTKLILVIKSGCK